MKKLIFIIFAIFLLKGNVFSQSGWQILSSNTSRDLEAVYFTDLNVGHVSGMGVFLKTINGGINWSKDTISFSDEFDCLHFPTQNVGYSGSWQGKIVKTYNAGANWILLPNPSMIPVYTVFFTTECTGFISDQDTIKRTSDCGFNWSNVNTQSFGAKRMFFINQQTGWATAGTNPYILKTTDGGFTWFPKPAPPLYEIWSVYFVNSLTGIAVGYTNTSGVVSLILKSTTGGENWVSKYNGPYGGQLTDVNMCSDGFGYSVGYGGVILKTTNLGENWSRDTSGVGTHLRGIHYSGDAFYVVGVSGVILKSPHIVGGIKPISSEVPKSYSLSQNYPNPFNPITNIRFDLPKVTETNLIIYDELGREVTTLVNEKLSAGSYQVDWDGSGYPSGVYFYRLAAGDFVSTRKMLLVK